MKTKAVSFEDIVFENRNKEYGAYELRKRYSKRGSLALLISMGILLFAVGGPLIANILNQRAYKNYVEKFSTIDFENVKKDVNHEPPPPPPPPPLKQIQEIKFIAPKVVDTITDQIVELPFFDVGGYQNSDVDTAPPVKEKVEIVKTELDDEILTIPELTEMPYFDGGDAALIKYVAEHTTYPILAQERDIQGTVYIRFVVTKNGKIGEAIVLRSADPLLDNEALKVVKSLPKWTPGKKNGNPVNVWFIIPVKFKLQ